MPTRHLKTELPTLLANALDPQTHHLFTCWRMHLVLLQRQLRCKNEDVNERMKNVRMRMKNVRMMRTKNVNVDVTFDINVVFAE